MEESFPISSNIPSKPALSFVFIYFNYFIVFLEIFLNIFINEKLFLKMKKNYVMKMKN